MKLGEDVVIKSERLGVLSSYLLVEQSVYQQFVGRANPGLATFLWFGADATHRHLVMKRLGPNLADIFQALNFKFSALTVILIAEQVVGTLQYFHDNSFIHRCLMPEHFLTGVKENARRIFLVDLAYVKPYRNRRTKKHMAYREGRSFVGSPRYASINSHLGVELSRRDDLENLGVVLIYLAKGRLPWQGIMSKSKRQKRSCIGDQKIATSVNTLCVGVPSELKIYMDYCKSLRFEDKPNYIYLVSLFDEALGNYKYGDPSMGPDWIREKLPPYFTALLQE